MKVSESEKGGVWKSEQGEKRHGGFSCRQKTVLSQEGGTG